MQMDAQRLKTLVAKAGLKNAQLARRLGVTPKTVGRWMKGHANPPEPTINKIANELGIPVQVLTGEAKMEQPSQPNLGTSRSRVGADVSARTRNAFILASARYGVSQTQIIELAPLMFTLIAEGSLEYRRGILERAGEHVDALNDMADGFSSYLRSHRAEEGMYDEQNSIEGRDIFGQSVGEDTHELGYYQPTQNPFFRYLQLLVKGLSDEEAIHLDDDEDIHVENVPAFALFHEETRKLSEGDADLANDISQGTIDLGKLPKELRTADASAERVDWLRRESDRVREEARKLLETLDVQI